MQITVKIKLLPTKEQVVLIEKTMRMYMDMTNTIMCRLLAETATEFTSRNVHAERPSALKNRATGCQKHCA